MPASLSASRLPVLLTLGATFLFFAEAAHASPAGRTGSVIQRMCGSADKVKTLAVMCNSYLDGYLDAARTHGRGKEFCVDDADRPRVPAVLSEWIDAHPESLAQPAGEVLHRALIERFPCRAKK